MVKHLVVNLNNESLQQEVILIYHVYRLHF